jgi:1-acyl-sn-glycerol-3-phosphate acyltransferase
MNAATRMLFMGVGAGVEVKRTLDAAGVLARAAAGDLFHGGRGDPLEEWDPDFIDASLPALECMSRLYFRSDVRGLENIPAEGPVLLVGNHSGGLLIADTFVFQSAFYRHFGSRRRSHQLAHDLVAKTPGLASLRRYGTVPASPENGRRALEAGAALLVYPGGDHETFRPSWESSRVDFDGRSGFVRLALKMDVPIVPVVAIGGQETALFITRGRRLAELAGLNRLRVKVLPLAISPPFGLTVFDLPGRIPLPSQITVQVLPPLDLRARFGAEPDEGEVYGEVTETMQRTLDELDEERDLPVLGNVLPGDGAQLTAR